MRKIVREAKWNVTLTPVGPQAQPLEKQIEAPTQDAAIRRAIQMFPGMQFLRTEAVALDPQTVPLGQQPVVPQQALPRQPVGLRGLQPLRVPGQQQQQQQQQEGVDPRHYAYPYSIRLPAQFARVLHESSPVPVSERSGQYEVILCSGTDMRSFLGRLQKHRNQDVARVILDGIRSSRGVW